MILCFKYISYLPVAALLFVNMPVKCQEGWQPVKADVAAREIVDFNKRILQNQTYSFTIRYASYPEYTSTEPHDTQSGIVIKDGTMIHSNISGALTIENKKLRVVADSTRHFVKIGNPLQSPDLAFNAADYVKVINNCKSVKRKETEGLIAYRIELRASKGVVAREIYLANDFVAKSITYYANEHKTKQGEEIRSEMLHPRLEMSISNFKKLDKVDKSVFDTDDILIVNKNQVTLKGKYKTFKFFDGRIKK